MHTLVRRYIKTAIAFLFVGLAIGAWMILRREMWRRFPGPYETSAHTHAIFAGFVMMMILGVALWLFPRPEKGNRGYDARGWQRGARTRRRTVLTIDRLAIMVRPLPPDCVTHLFARR